MGASPCCPTIVEESFLEDAEVAFVSYGSVSRAVKHAVYLARQKGIKAGSIQLKTLWPFPTAYIRKQSERIPRLIVPEMNLGKMVKEVQLAANRNCTVVSFPKVGGVCHTPNELLAFLERGQH